MRSTWREARKKTFVIEDSYNGIRAAHAGGMMPVMVPDMLQPTEEIEKDDDCSVRKSAGCEGKDRTYKNKHTFMACTQMQFLDQCGKCFWRILIDFVSGAGDDMQMGLRQECVQLFCGFEICTIPFFHR